MNIGEAQAANTVMRYWLRINDPYDPPATGHISDDEAFNAMLLLARRAHARLGAGIRPDQVVEAWAGRQRF